MRAQYRKVVVYVAGDADAMSFLGMLGFGPVPVPTEEQKAVSMLLAGVAKAASGDTSSRQMRGALSIDPDGRLALVANTDPRTVVLEAGPAAKVPLLIMPAGRN